jgi:hypothetical protein
MPTMNKPDGVAVVRCTEFKQDIKGLQTMNALNVSKAIAVMERVKERSDSFSMRQWQFPREDSGGACTSEDDLHECRMPACFGGWIAVSPEFIADGGSVSSKGAPMFGSDFPGSDSIGAWLGISEDDSDNLCGFFVHSGVYRKKPIWGVGVDDVLKVLYRLRDTGSVW